MTIKIVKVPLRTASAPHRFDPEEVTIKVGETVKWENDDTSFHTVTPENAGAFPSGTLDEQGATYSHQFEAAGQFPYFCEIHASMVGLIAVEDRGSVEENGT